MSHRNTRLGAVKRRMTVETLERRELFTLTPFGGELIASSDAPGDAVATFHSPDSVDANAQGAAVVVWTDLAGGGDVYFQRFIFNDPIGPAIRVHESAAGRQVRPAVAIDEAGEFVVAWADAGADGDSYGVYARRFTAQGVAKEKSFQVNVKTAGSQNRPSIAMDADGDFAVAWADSQGDADGYGIYVRRYDSAGVATAPRLVNRGQIGVQNFPTTAMHPDGELLVAWASADADGDGLGVAARRYDALGNAVGDEFVVNQTAAGSQTFPAAAYNAAEDRFAVVWTGPDADSVGVYARVFNSDGKPIAGQNRINQTTSGTQMLPDVVAAVGDEGYVVTWTDRSSQLSRVSARQIDGSGAPVDAAALVNEVAKADRSSASVAASAGGWYHVAYSGPDLDVEGRGVAVRLLRDAKPPVAAAGGGYQIPEGGVLTLSAADSFDPDGQIVSYAWDVNADGQFDRTTSQPRATFKWEELVQLGVDDGPQTYTIRLLVTDNAGLTDGASTSVFVANMPADRSIDGPTLAVLNSSPVFTFGPIVDAGDDKVAFMTVDWGDGETTTYNPALTQIAHRYTSTGQKTIRISLTDEDGVYHNVDTHTLTVFSLVILPPVVGLGVHATPDFAELAQQQGVSLLQAFADWKRELR